MITIAIVTRRLKEGKTYEDFRKAWFHTVGFGTPSRLYTMINAADPREIIVMGFVETDLDRFMDGLAIDVKERLGHSLDEIIEPEIYRTFGILISEDDFSDPGSIGYRPPSVNGKETDLPRVTGDLSAIAGMIAEASASRDREKKKRQIPGNGRE
jgi:hypothetical protein